jgi:hypothetical protein
MKLAPVDFNDDKWDISSWEKWWLRKTELNYIDIS